MNSDDKKEVEQRTIEHLLWILCLETSAAPEPGETPDFIIPTVEGRIGMEVTTFQSGVLTDDGVLRRNAEATWEHFEAAADEYRKHQPHLRELYVSLGFKGSMPPRREHLKLIQEISNFAAVCASSPRALDRDHWSMPTQLMQQYLDRVRFTPGPYPIWSSNINGGGWIGFPDEAVTRIVRNKSGKAYRPTDQLWLAIQCRPRVSELMFPLEGATDFHLIPGLDDALDTSPFARVFILTFGGGVYAWDRGASWSKLSREASPEISPLDPGKNY